MNQKWEKFIKLHRLNLFLLVFSAGGSIVIILSLMGVMSMNSGAAPLYIFPIISTIIGIGFQIKDKNWPKPTSNEGDFFVRWGLAIIGWFIGTLIGVVFLALVLLYLVLGDLLRVDLEHSPLKPLVSEGIMLAFGGLMLLFIFVPSLVNLSFESAETTPSPLTNATSFPTQGAIIRNTNTPVVQKTATPLSPIVMTSTAAYLSLNYGDTVIGYLDDDSYEYPETWTFSGTANDNIEIFTDVYTDGEYHRQIAWVVRLKLGDETLLESSNFNRGDYRLRLEMVLPVTGLYTIEVERATNRNGEFTLSLNQLAAPIVSATENSEAGAVVQAATTATQAFRVIAPSTPVLPSPTPRPIATVEDTSAMPEVTRNSDWQVTSTVMSNMQMVLVPLACFTMGSASAPNEIPAHLQCVEAFWIGTYEVTNQEYGSSGGFAGANRPREKVTYFDALNFCNSLGLRLPTEAEWELAARGPDNLIYPWGNNFIPNYLVYRDGNNDSTAPVASRPEGISWVGAHDMAGNVWEWTSSIFRPYPYNPLDGRENPNDTSSFRAIRGGSWDYGNEDVARSSFRAGDGYALSESDNGIGFRCAADYATNTASAVVSQVINSPTQPETIPITCPNNLPSRLVLGEQAFVVGGLDGNRLRSNAGVNFEQVGRIPPLGQFTVLAGPNCADGYTWWQVDYEGNRGWTAEGDNEVYWLEPIK